MIRQPKRPMLWVEIAASHFCAQTVWILTLLNADKLPRDRRLVFYFEMAVITVSTSVAACAVGWLIAGRLPRPLDIALLMLTPVSFLLSTEKTARGFELKLAFGLGLALLPLVHLAAPLLGLGAWELLVTGLAAGSLAFGLGRLRAPA